MKNNKINFMVIRIKKAQGAKNEVDFRDIVNNVLAANSS